MLKYARNRTVIGIVSLLLSLFSMAVGVAQAPVATSVSDVKLHVFQPNVSPDAVAERASISDRSLDSRGISAFAGRQISALAQDKDARTPAQQKISSNLIFTARMLQGQPAAPGIPSLYTGIELDENNNLAVDLVANVSEELLKQLESAGSRVLYQNASLRAIRALIPAGKLEAIAALPEVIHLSPRAQYITNQTIGNDSQNGTFVRRKAEVQRQLIALSVSATPGTPTTGQGVVETEGNQVHLAAAARGLYGVNGAGLKIGVLSDGVVTRAASQATGDLPPDCGTGVSLPCLKVLAGQEGEGDEGTAMLEIIHDMVPGADLYFASAFNGIASFANNIRALRAAGCQIIVDDVFYDVESPFQDGQTATVHSTENAGVVTQAVNEVVADGAFYFSSAGNEGNKDLGTSGTYEGDFSGIAATSPLPSGSVHDFGGGVGYDTITGGGLEVLLLHWADPLGASSNDYDLYLLSNNGLTVLATSNDVQNGTQDPIEGFSSSNLSAGRRVVVFKKDSAQNRFLHLMLLRGGLQVATAGETHGHSAASGAYTVAATPAVEAWAATPAGPYPAAFNSANSIESFSSDGPRRYFFRADSTPVTAGNFSATGGAVLNKPEITAADGVSVTGVGGFGSPFYGTSAAAPSAAAVAALVLAAKPTITAAEMKSVLTSTAVDIMANGWDRDSGSGIVMAKAALQALGITGRANPELQQVTATEDPGDGNGSIDNGEGVQLHFLLKNTGVAAATGLVATLSTLTPGVILQMPATTTFPDMAIGATGVVNQLPVRFTLAPDAQCAAQLVFSLTTTFSGGQTRSQTFYLPTTMVNIANTMGSTPAVPSNLTFATGVQTGRLSRDYVPSVCGSPKSYPGAYDVVSHIHDSYSFTACHSGCLAVEVDSATDGANLLGSVYVPTLNSANLGTNYAGDAGLSSAAAKFGVSMTAGTNYTVVVNEINGNSPAKAYSLQFPRCAIRCDAYPLPIAKAKNMTVVAARTGGTVAANIDNGSNDPDGGAVTLSQSPAGPYPVGTTTVILTAANKFGAFAQDTANVTVLNPAVADLNTTALDFGAVPVNQSSNARILTVNNSGGLALHLSANPVVSGTNAADFTVSSSTCTAADPVPVSGHCDINLIFRPTALGARSATLTLTDDAENTPQTVALSGVGGSVATITSATGTATSYSSAAQNVTLSAAVSGNFGAINQGHMTFKVFSGSTLIGSAVDVTVAQNLATASYALPAGTAAGSYTFSAEYADASGVYLASSDTAHSLTINPAATSIALSSSINPVLVNTTSTLTATVTSAGGTPSGSVTFLSGATPLGTATLSGGIATLPFSSATTGTQSLTATYASTANYAASASSALSEVVFDITLASATGGSSTLATVTAPKGGSAVFTFQLAPASGATFPAKVTYAISGAPAGATSVFNPTEIAAGAGATTVTLTITLPAQMAMAPLPQRGAPLLLALLLLPWARRMRRLAGRLGQMTFLAVLLLAGAAGLAGLSGCATTSASQNYPLTFTATSGGSSHATSALLIVQ